MTKSIKVGLVLCLFLMSFAVVQLFATVIRYCPEGLCRGQCGCEGELRFEDICCFYCKYNGWPEIDCCHPSYPGGSDGCQVWGR